MYWSNSRFADWLRGTKKPEACTWEEWDTWHNYAAKSHPLRYWLAEAAIDAIQALLLSPLNATRRVNWWIHNALIDKTHVLSSPNLKRGEYYDLDQRILYCLFDELVRFVEVGYARRYMGIVEGKNIWNPFWSSREIGLKAVRAEIDLIEQDSQKFGPSMQPTKAALQEIIDLYLWWTEERPNRQKTISGSASESFRDYDGEFDEEAQDSAMLLRLTQVWRFLWI
jgi:hypothetical protein